MVLEVWTPALALHRQEGLTGPGLPGPPAGWGKGAGPGCWLQSTPRQGPRVLASQRGLRGQWRGGVGERGRLSKVTQGHQPGHSRGSPVEIKGRQRDRRQSWGRGLTLRGLVSATSPAPPQQTPGCEEQHRLVGSALTRTSRRPSTAAAGPAAPFRAGQRQRVDGPLPPPPAGCAPKSSVRPRHTPA